MDGRIRLVMNNKLWYLKQLDIFAGFPAEKISAISQLMGTKNVGKKEIILEPEDHDKVFLLKSGSVDIYQITADGKKIILDRIGPGGIFGDLGISETDENFAEATTDAFLCTLTKDQFFEVVSKNPELSARLMKIFLSKLKQAEKTIGSLASDNLIYKFTSLLHRLATGHGEETNEKIEIKERFTHEELASMLGISRQTMTKLINTLEKQNIISREGKQIIFNKKRFENEYV